MVGSLPRTHLMFSTFKQRIFLGIYVFIILSIPIGAYLASQNQTYKSSATEVNTKIPKKTSSLPLPDATKSASTSAIKELLSLAESDPFDPSNSSDSSAAPEPSSPTIATSFGPTLSLKAALEGRPAQNQATKLFIGILEGALGTNPKFLLSFSVDLPADGTYSNLSLAGLNPGTKYTALLKGSSQIATSSAFTMSPTVTNLNEGELINLLTGDLNEDNVINSADYTIVQKIIGINSASASWNENADFNKDKLINLFDIGYITKNMGKEGASGTWTSPLPKVASPSSSLATNPNPQGGPPTHSVNSGQASSGQGYWIWVPK